MFYSVAIKLISNPNYLEVEYRNRRNQDIIQLTNRDQRTEPNLLKERGGGLNHEKNAYKWMHLAICHRGVLHLETTPKVAITNHNLIPLPGRKLIRWFPTILSSLLIFFYDFSKPHVILASLWWDLEPPDKFWGIYWYLPSLGKISLNCFPHLRPLGYKGENRSERLC